MAQEIDRSETLQAKSVASQQAVDSQRSREAVRAETRNLQADGQLRTVGELADAVAVPTAPEGVVAQRRRADVKAELAEWRSTHKLVVGERG